MTIFDRVKTLSEKKGKNLKSVATELGFGENYFYTLKKQSPKAETLEQIASYFNVSTDYLLGRTEEPYWKLTGKDEKDIQTDLESMIDGLNNDDALAFMKNGDSELSEEDAALLRASMEQTLRLSKELAKRKFTPKQYRNNDE